MSLPNHALAEGSPRNSHEERKGFANESTSNRAAIPTSELALFIECLRDSAIEVQQIYGCACRADSQVHDKAAVIPAVVISPKSEWGVIQSLKLIKSFGLCDRVVPGRSGGHGCFSRVTLCGIMMDLSAMNKRAVMEDVLYLEPGCISEQAVDLLARRGKAVPHGEFFGADACGHPLTSGVDVLLTRRFSLDCQSVVGGRVILWDGTAIEVTERSHRDLLGSMRGGAAAGVGIVTEIQLRLGEQPAGAA